MGACYHWGPLNNASWETEAQTSKCELVIAYVMIRCWVTVYHKQAQSRQAVHVMGWCTLRYSNFMGMAWNSVYSQSAKIEELIALTCCDKPTERGYFCQMITNILLTYFLSCLYCLKCMKFGHLILRKIIKIVATICQILRLKMYQIRCHISNA